MELLWSTTCNLYIHILFKQMYITLDKVLFSEGCLIQLSKTVRIINNLEIYLRVNMMLKRTMLLQEFLSIFVPWTIFRVW